MRADSAACREAGPATETSCAVLLLCVCRVPVWACWGRGKKGGKWEEEATSQLRDNSWQLCSFSTSQLHGLPATRMYGTTDVCVLYEVKKRRGTLLPNVSPALCRMSHGTPQAQGDRQQPRGKQTMSGQCFERVVRWYNETKATKGHPAVADEGGAPSDGRADAAGLTARHCAHLRRRAADWARWEAGKGRPPTGMSKSAKRRMRKQEAKEARTSA